MSRTLTNIKKFIIQNKYLLAVLLIGGVLRFANLGYSDFQGDEIKALFLPEEGQDTLTYLLDQRKGPVQFVITFLLKYADPMYQNQFLMRLPFALAGFVSIYYFYKLIEQAFNEKIAFFATFFFATNGFLIAFSRIVQYQSFVIMFMLGALYYLKNKRIYLGLIFWALSILAHYDGVFIFPVALYYIYQYLADTDNAKNLIKLDKVHLNKSHLIHFIFAGLIAIALLASFYIPFVLNISGETQSYWLGRLTGEVSNKLSSSVYLFTVYQPIYVIHIYSILFLLGMGYLSLKMLKIKYPDFAKTKLIKSVSAKLGLKLAPFENLGEVTSFALWLFIALIFMEVLVYIPGTHVYTYLIPVTVVLAYGISLIEKVILKILKKNTLFIVGVSLIFSFIALQSYAIYIENKYEYPWEQEKFLVWTLPQPSPIYHLSMFGFPYYRDWEEIQTFVESRSAQPAYSTNERKSIARHYIDLPKDTDQAGFFVYIKNPQSFTNEVIYEKADYWVQAHSPDYIFSRNGRDFVRVYVMEPGTKEEIQIKGF